MHLAQNRNYQKYYPNKSLSEAKCTILTVRREKAANNIIKFIII